MKDKGNVDPRGNKTDYTYDGFGQRWERSSPDTGITTWTYSTDGQLQNMMRADGTQLTYAYDSLGRPTSISTGSQTRSVVYDSCTNGIGRVCCVFRAMPAPISSACRPLIPDHAGPLPSHAGRGVGEAG